MVIIKNSCMVKPNEPTPNLKLWLSECDQLLFPAPYFSIFFIYPPQLNNSVSTPFETLQMSLSRVLVSYFPFAGRLNRIGRDRFELHCTAMGAELIEAESEAQHEDFGDFCPTPKTRMLAPHIDYTKDVSELPLLAVQVTRFKCGGISIGFAFSHIVSDGKSIFQFIISWAQIALGEQEIIEPFHDRTIFYKGNPCAEPRFDHVEFKTPPILIENSDQKGEQMKEITTRMLKLSKNQVESLKKMANESRSKEEQRSHDYTSYQVLAVYIWKCASKARRLQNEQLTSLRMTVNCSNRFRPALPLGYFGNTILRAISIAEVGELLSDPRLGHACSKIRNCLRKIYSEYIESAIDFSSSQQDLSPFRMEIESLFHGNPNIGITSWIGGPIYEVDFGWGKPVFFGPAEMDFDGKAYVIPGRDEDGYFLVPMSLDVTHMDDFVRLFYERIDCLS